MAKVGKLTKLKSIIKKLPSFTKNHHSTVSTATSQVPKCDDLQMVYVGKSRRPYMLSSHVVDHPLFQELLDRSSRCVEEKIHNQEIALVACEVVLFEHLLWMLKNSCSDHGDGHGVEELAEFYTY